MPKTTPALSSEIWQFIFHPTPEQREADQNARPFFLLITALLTAVSLLAVYERLILGAPARLVAYTLLLALHIALHWFSARLIDMRRWPLAYLILQGVLGVVIVLLAASPALALALFASLIGEAIGVFGLTRSIIGAVIGYLVLLPASYYLIGGEETLANWTSPTTSTVILLITFMVLFRKQIDAGERAQALADELETANRQLAEYANQVEELTLTAERQRMARELHDTLAQGVAGLVMQLEAVRHHLGAANTERAEAIIVRALARARSTLADSRAAIDDLRAVPASLPEAIRAKTERFTQATGIPCELALALGDIAPPPDTSDHLLRILSEALANVTRHAQATRVWVRLEDENGQLELEIRDDGQGFELDTATRAGHYGLLGIRERARLIGGNLTIETGPGKGTRIHLVVPISPKTG